MARHNIDVFLEAGVDRIVVASAGCGSAMKEYHQLLANDPAYADKAEQFSRLTQDITELLVSLPFDPPKATLNRKVTYQDACHLAHAQRITAAPREILKSIPGLELVEMEQAAMCWRSGGALFSGGTGASGKDFGPQDDQHRRHWSGAGGHSQPGVHDAD